MTITSHECHGVWNHQYLIRLFNGLLRLRRKYQRSAVLPVCYWGNRRRPVDSPHNGLTSNAKGFNAITSPRGQYTCSIYVRIGDFNVISNGTPAPYDYRISTKPLGHWCARFGFMSKRLASASCLCYNITARCQLLLWDRIDKQTIATASVCLCRDTTLLHRPSNYVYLISLWLL